MLFFFFTNQDCDQDHDCNFGLVCFKKKKATQNVPGCSGNAGFRDVVGKGFCVEPAKANILVLVGDNDQPSSLSAFPLQECQGDCDSGKLEPRVVGRVCYAVQNRN